TLNKVADELQNALPHKFTMITLGDKGIFTRFNSKSIIKDAHHREITDVSGAGDTVISVAALCVAAGADQELITEISNIAGGLVCEFPGVVPLDHEKLLEETLKVSGMRNNE
ncbi:MAG: PfkB family carbohydrate kinase, partial [Chitinophagales bacterium]